MYDQSLTYFAGRRAQLRPLFFVQFTTNFGKYVFAKKFPGETESGLNTAVPLWNGTRAAGDGGRFGEFGPTVIDARILQLGNLDQTSTPTNKELWTSFSQTRLPSYAVVCDNTDKFFTRHLSRGRGEIWLLRQMEVLQGWEGCRRSDLQRIFIGAITEIRISKTKCAFLSEPSIATGDSAGGSGISRTESMTLLGAQDDGTGIIAQETYVDTALSSTFTALLDTAWQVQFYFRKTALNDAGVLFELEHATYSFVRLQIGISAANKVYVMIGQNITTGTRSNTTYTDTYVLTSADILNPINLKVRYDGTKLYFRVNTTENSQNANAADTTTDGANETLTVGSGFDGIIRSMKWQNSYLLMNGENDNTLLNFPENKGNALGDLPLVDGTWANWD
jgi:hypothetical protein